MQRLAVLTPLVDKDSKFYAISFASRQLKDHEKTTLFSYWKLRQHFWGKDFFNDYLWGKQFILYMDHEKLGPLHNKTLNRLQSALLEHDFVIQYKKGSNMPSDYLSQLPNAGTSNDLDMVTHCLRSLPDGPLRPPNEGHDFANGSAIHDHQPMSATPLQG
jgi:hypothetical protein